MAKRKGLANYSNQELWDEIARRNLEVVYRVYTQFPDSSREFWRQTFPTQAEAIAAVHHNQKVWSADPIYVVAPDGSEARIDPPNRRYGNPGRCSVCHNPNCTEPNGQH